MFKMEESELRKLISALFIECQTGSFDDKMQYAPSLLSNTIFYMRAKFLDPAASSTVKFRTRLHEGVKAIIANYNKFPPDDPRYSVENAQIQQYFNRYIVKCDNKDEDDIAAMELIAAMERLEECRKHLYFASDQYAFMQGGENPVFAFAEAQKHLMFVMYELNDILQSFKIIDVSVSQFEKSREKAAEKPRFKEVSRV